MHLSKGSGTDANCRQRTEPVTNDSKVQEHPHPRTQDFLPVLAHLREASQLGFCCKPEEWEKGISQVRWAVGEDVKDVADGLKSVAMRQKGAPERLSCRIIKLFFYLNT